MADRQLAVVSDNTPKSLDIDLSVMEQVIALGDLSVLSKEQRLHYYRAVCDSIRLNWRTQPFGYIKLNGKLVLYALKNAAEQLRQVYGVSIVDIKAEHVGDLYVVTATAKDRTGRVDSDMGAVAVAGLRGDALANGMKKAVTQAKRRVTLSICGLGMLDETEAPQVPGAQVVQVDDFPAPAAPTVTEVVPIYVDPNTGEIIEGEVRAAPAERKSGYAPRVQHGRALSEKQFGKILAECSDRGIDDNARHALLIAQFAKESLNDLLMIEASAFIDWLVNQPPEVIAAAIGEATRAQAKARGQTEMPMPEESPATFRVVPRDQVTDDPVQQGVTETGEVISWTVAWKRLRELGCENQMHWIELTGKAFPKDDPQAAITLYQLAAAERDQAIDGTAGNDRYSR